MITRLIFLAGCISQRVSPDAELSGAATAFRGHHRPRSPLTPGLPPFDHERYAIDQAEVCRLGLEDVIRRFSRVRWGTLRVDITAHDRHRGASCRVRGGGLLQRAWHAYWLGRRAQVISCALCDGWNLHAISMDRHGLRRRRDRVKL